MPALAKFVQVRPSKGPTQPPLPSWLDPMILRHSRLYLANALRARNGKMQLVKLLLQKRQQVFCDI